jgi:hypothetical protein
MVELHSRGFSLQDSTKKSRRPSNGEVKKINVRISSNKEEEEEEEEEED